MEKQIVTTDEQVPRFVEKENEYLAMAKAIVIDSDQSLIAADALSMCLLALEKEIKADFKDSKKAADEAHKAIVAQEKAHLDRVQEPRSILRPKIVAYQESQENARIAEEKRLQAIADKQAEDAALAAAGEAEKSGDAQQAEAILQAPIVAAPVILARTTPKVQTRIPRTWTFKAKEIKDLTNAELLASRAYLSWDTVKLGAQSRSTHDSVAVAGVTFYAKP